MEDDDDSINSRVLRRMRPRMELAIVRGSLRLCMPDVRQLARPAGASRCKTTAMPPHRSRAAMRKTHLVTLTPCPHREVIPGPLATLADLAAWAAEHAATPCPACAAPVAPAQPVAALPPLPDAVALALTHEGRAGARRAQVALDALAVGAELYPAIAARLRAQPGTGPYWRKWWAEWRGGAIVKKDS